jgi:hypothetical protein
VLLESLAGAPTYSGALRVHGGAGGGGGAWGAGALAGGDGGNGPSGTDTAASGGLGGSGGSSQGTAGGAGSRSCLSTGTGCTGTASVTGVAALGTDFSTATQHAGGGGGGGGLVVAKTAAGGAVTNEVFASAHALGNISSPQIFSAPIGSMINNVDGDQFDSGPDVCTADELGKDAFFSFTVSAATTVVIDAAGTDFDHTIALFNKDVLNDPSALRPVAATPLPGAIADYETVNANPVLGTVGDPSGNWRLYSGSMATLSNSLAPRALAAATTSAVQLWSTPFDVVGDLGETVAAATGAATGNSYPESTMQCGGNL